MASNREEALRLRNSAKKRCTSRRNQVLGLIRRKESPEEPELLALFDKFVESINYFNDCCDQVGEFGDDSGPEDTAN